MVEWIKGVFQQAGFGLTALPLAFLFGLVSAFASACCTLPVLGAVVGYSGARKDADRRAALYGAVFFMLGTILALVILGSVAGFIGQVAQDALGKYWRVFAGVTAIVFGLAALKLLPIRLPVRALERKPRPKDLFGAATFGLIMGGGVAVASLPCNPGIFIVLGVAVLEGHMLWAMATLGAFAVGFSLPLGAVMLGVSFWSLAVKAKRTLEIIRVVAGLALLGAGFYLVGTI